MEPFLFESATLPCGLKVLWQHDDRVNYVELDLSVWVGHFDNPEGLEGMVHLFEHVPFRGTRNFPTNDELAGPVEAIGGSIGAFTRLDYTQYYVRVPAQELNIGMARIIDLVFSARLGTKDYQDEYEVILSEMAEAENNFPSTDWVNMFKQIHGGGWERRSWGLGWPDTIRNITANHLHQFRDEYYRPDNMQLVIGGNLSACKPSVVDLVSSWFNGWPPCQPRDRIIRPQQPTGLPV